MMKRLVITIMRTKYHQEAIGAKVYTERFYDLKKAEKRYFELDKDDCVYVHTAINISQEEAKQAETKNT